MENTRPIAIDLFAGCGGMSLGFEQAGFDVVAAVEIDPVHAAAHKFNFPDCAVIPQSVVGLTGAKIREAARIDDRVVDVVCGGAPCQGFSLIGQRAIDDPRNLLVREFVRIVKELEPRAFVFENVKGLTLGKHRQFLDELIEEFTEAGYSITSPVKVLNAKDYGVPQSRERLFLIGTKDGDVATYPKPAGVGPTCADALGDLPDAEAFATLIESDEVNTNRWGAPSAYASEMRCLTNDAWHFGHVRAWDTGVLTSSNRTAHTEISRRRFAEGEQGRVEPISRFFKLAPDGISNTLRAGTDASRGAFTSPRPIHYAKARCVTVREMGRLHGFPDWFRFHRTKWHGARQIGNAVPPPLARAVAGSVVEALGIEPARPGGQIALGDKALLTMDMSAAARFWGVAVPVGKRDKKSGARKRKQSETEAERLSQIAAE